MSLAETIGYGAAIAITLAVIARFLWWMFIYYPTRFERATAKAARTAEQSIVKPYDLANVVTSRTAKQEAPLPYN